MKEFVKRLLKPIISIFLFIYIAWLRLRGRFFNPRTSPSVLILPPAEPGSLGDEALVTGLLTLLEDKGIKKIGLVSYKPELQWEIYRLETYSFELRHHFLGGYLGSLIAPFYFLNAVHQYQKFYCIGADVMDGYYSLKDSLQRINFVDLATRLGIEAALVSFSFNDRQKPEIIEALNKLPLDVRICVRDPVSYERLSKLLQRPIALVADLAFLLPPVQDSPTVLTVGQWIKEQRSNNKVILGINANYKLVESLKLKTLDDLIKIYVTTLVELKSKNADFSFVLIPHDFRDTQGMKSDVGLAKGIYQALPQDLQSNCFIVPSPCSASEIKGICRQLDMVVSGRMHLAIASLGQGIPAACITYQGKFEGLFKHLELEGMTLEPEKVLQPEKLVQFLMP